MKNLITVITASIFTATIAISSASAIQAAPQSSEKAKEMMEGKAKAKKTKMKKKPPSNE